MAIGYSSSEHYSDKLEIPSTQVCKVVVTVESEDKHLILQTPPDIETLLEKLRRKGIQHTTIIRIEPVYPTKTEEVFTLLKEAHFIS